MADTGRPLPPSPARAATAVLLSVAGVVGGTAAYATWAPDVPVARIALAGDGDLVRRLVQDYPQGALASAQGWDLWLIAGYGLALVLGSLLGTRVFYTAGARRTAWLALIASAVAVGADLAENTLMWSWDRGGPDGLLDWAAVAAGLKWALLLVAVPVALSAHAVTVTRLLALRRSVTDVPAAALLAPPPCVDADVDPHLGAVVPADQHWRDGAAVPPGRDPADVGISVSGGGIRSGCVTLGALQELRSGGVLGRAEYLVSVSGGGFVAAAFQLALQPPRDAAGVPVQGKDGPLAAAASPADVFAPGSVEEDHLRRHSNYLSDGAREWALALLVVLRGLLSSLTLAALTVMVVGIGLGAFYTAVPYVDLDALRTLEPLRPDVPAGTTTLILALLGVAAAAYGLWLMLLGTQGHTGWPVRAGLALASTAALVALVGVGLPLLFWVSSRLVVDPTPAEATGSAIGPVLITYVGTLVGLLWRGNEKVGGKLKALRGKGGLAKKAPVSLVQRVIVLASLLVLLVALALLLGTVAVESPAWHWGWRLGLPALLVAAYFLLDQTWLSLHPFYRKRLATAFAVRRARRGGRAGAQAYDWEETTRLDVYGQKVPGFPRLLLAAAANLSGQSRTPPGRRAVSFTFGADYVGGPHVGYVRTKDLLEAVPTQLSRDLTLQAAVAVSGAAFASAMGRHARAYETFLALSNARLGTWLPNPAFLLARSKGPDDWALPRLPRLRRLTYQLREIVGLFPDDDRLLLCTDGGHVENLGLVELLRHGVRTVYVVDASGDTPPFAHTLAEAISLAREELGIVIELTDPLSLVPGSATPLDPTDPLADLNGRLSAASVVTGTITYPRDVRFPAGTGRTGRIVVAKAGLTSDMPYPLLAYAAANPAFPRDNTSDQWFDIGQFDAYTAMGRHLGAVAAALDPWAPADTVVDLTAAEQAAAGAGGNGSAATVGAPSEGAQISP